MRSRRLPIAALAAALALASTLACGAGSASAAATGWWVLGSSSAPTTLVPGKEGEIIASALNAGYRAISGAAGKTMVLKDTLPPGLEVTHVLAEAGPDLEDNGLGRPRNILTCTTEARTVSCPWTGSVEETETIRAQIYVKPLEAESNVTNAVAIVGGSVPTPPELKKSLTVAAAPTKYGVENYEIRPENEYGELETHAGAHPFQLTTIFDVNEAIEEHQELGKGTTEIFPTAAALTKNLHFVLPAGLVGKAAKVPRCSGAAFATLTPGDADLCPKDTAIGYANVAANLHGTADITYFEAAVPVFNLTPSPGEPARFGFEDHDVPVVLTTRVLSGSSYGIEVTVNEATEAAAVIASQVTLWGVPDDARHDQERGWQCLERGWYLFDEINYPAECEPKAEPNGEAFLTMPTSCEASASYPLSTVTGEAWDGESFGLGEESPVEYRLPQFTDCESLPFNPAIHVQPDKSSAATPSGITVEVEVPQATTLSGETGVYGEADISSTELALPVGVAASAGAADGLATCTSKGFGFDGFEAPGAEAEIGQLAENDHFNEQAIDETECPAAAKIGTVDIETPLLEEHLTGSVYLAREHTFPFESPLVLYIFAESETSHVQVKLAGTVNINQSNGQLVSVFSHTPPVPFSKLTLHLFDGERASQSTPETCGSYPSSATFHAVSGENAVASSSFAITSGPGGQPCAPAGTQPFAPGFEAKSENPSAGAFSPFVVTIERPDGQQALKSVSVTEPPGAAAMLANVTPCPLAAAEAQPPTCPASSRIGESVALAGLGSDPEELSGEAFLTAGFGGAPFGLLDVTNATKVGPFDIGYIPVLSKITVNDETAQATVTTDGAGEPDPLPQFVKGVPSQIKKLVIDVNRPEFAFNPTNCEKHEVTGTLTGFGSGLPEGTEAVSSPYYASGCASLPFHPTISLSVESNVSRVDGTGMKIVVKSSTGQANIKLTHLVFPNSVPSRLTTIQKACPDYVFDANPANCDEGSVIGSAIAHTPVLKAPLTGPVYLVSHASAAFPDAEFVLQGEGIKLVLDGKTFIHEGVTSSTFESVPDAPVESFEVDLPRGPHSAFSGYGELCTKSIEVPTTFGGQNGFKIEGKTKVEVEGCKGVLPSKTESELAKLLKTCKKQKNHGKRVKCEANARKRVSAIASCKKKDKGKKKKLAACEATARKKYAVKG